MILKRILSNLFWLILALSVIVLEIYHSYSSPSILLATLTYLVAARFLIATISNDYSSTSNKYSRRLEYLFLYRNPDNIIAFKEWVNPAIWGLFGFWMLFSFWFFMSPDWNAANYFLVGGILLLFNSYLLYIRRKAFFRSIHQI